jgi:hypothetical protein
MPSPFAITTTANAVSLDAQRHGEASFTVSNTSGSPIRSRAQLAPQAPASTTWLTLREEAEQDFPAGGTEQFAVKIAIPADTPAGSYSFRLDVVGVENPDELYTQGPSVTFQVPEPKTKKHFPWWIVFATMGALALCCALGVGGYFVATNLPEPTTTPSATPTLTPTPTRTPKPTPHPEERLIIGKWRTKSDSPFQIEVVFDRNGQVTTSAPESLRPEQATGTYEVDFSFKPGHLDAVVGAEKSLCIIEFIDNDTIRMECSDVGGRPAKFSDNAIELQRR